MITDEFKTDAQQWPPLSYCPSQYRDESIQTVYLTDAMGLLFPQGQRRVPKGSEDETVL